MSKGEEREKAYNRTREKEYIASRIQSDEQFVEEMRKLYRESMRQIEDDMARWLGRYATVEGISYDEALARAAKTDVKALAAKAKKYVKEKNFSEIANEMLRRYNLRLRMSRAELLHHEMELELIALGDAEAKLTGSYLAQQYFEEIDRQAGILRMSVPEKEHLLNQARSVVDSSWKNATWSQRIWKNNEDLRAGLGKGLRASMLEGRNPGDWANKLQRVLQKEMVSRKGRGNAEFLSERLAITEAGRVQIEAQLRSFDAMGYDALEVITEPGACAECLPHDGEIVPLKDARMGENIPMFHPFCRCSTAAYYSSIEMEKNVKAVNPDGWRRDLKTRKIASDILRRARKEEKIVTKDLMEAVGHGSGHLSGLEYKIKGKDSLVRKLSDKSKEKGLSIEEYAKRITDALRYTNVSEPAKLVSDFFEIQKPLEKKGYTFVEIANTLKVKTSAYRGINTLMKTKDGYVFEFQFHTPQSLEVKEINHKLYEEFRLPSTSKDRKIELNKMMIKNSTSIVIPNDIQSIEDKENQL